MGLDLTSAAVGQLQAQLLRLLSEIDNFLVGRIHPHDVVFRLENLKTICTSLLQEADDAGFDQRDWVKRVFDFLSDAVELLQSYCCG